MEFLDELPINKGNENNLVGDLYIHVLKLKVHECDINEEEDNENIQR